MSDLLKIIVKEMDKHHATNIRVLDFHGISADYDYFVIGSASNQRLAWSMMDYVEDELYKNGYTVRSKEGSSESKWILLDCVDVIVHLFIGEEREVYQLEKLWGDLEEVRIELC